MQLAHIATELYQFFALNPLYSKALIKESLFMHESLSDILNKEGRSLLDKVENLFKSAIDRAELDPRTDCRSAALSCMSFFLLGLIGGLREPDFNVKKQTLFFASLLDNNLTGKSIQKNR